MKIIAIDAETGERIEITDLYWFEEQGVHDLMGEAFYDRYTFEFEIERDDVLLPSAAAVEKIIPAESAYGRRDE